MKILLLNPPNGRSYYLNRDLMGGLGVGVRMEGGLPGRIMSLVKARSIRLPVLSLSYCATILARDHDVRVVDAANLDLSVPRTRKAILDFAPDWVLSWTSTSGLWEELAFLTSLKEGRSPVVGLLGNAAASRPREVFDGHPIDFIVKGEEPEGIMSALSAAGTFRGQPGVLCRDGTGWLDGGETGAIGELDRLPFPRWDLFPVESYRYFPILRRRPFLTILSTRGCPYGCIYCPYTSNQGTRYRHRSVENVLDELSYLKERFGVAAVQFRDPTFSLRRARTFRICEGILDRGLELEWGAETRIDCLDDRLMDKMVESGLRGINFGIESSDPGVIANTKRGWIPPDLIRERVARFADQGVRVSGFFILGLPGETPDSVQRTIEFAQELPLSYAEFKIATPFPGTPLFDMAKREGWVGEERLEDYTSYVPSMRVHPELDAPLLNRKANEAYRRFYASPSRVLREVTSAGFLTGLARSIVPIRGRA
jgi:anaerobic magnesium-protoporphyrin IX monomethyl ester cyclase